MPYRVRGREVQVLRSAGWRTLRVYESRALAKKNLMALLRSYAKEAPTLTVPAQPPPPRSGRRDPDRVKPSHAPDPGGTTGEGAPVAEVTKPGGVTDTPETPVTTPVGPKGPGAWHPAAEKYWVSLDADFKPWVAWLV